MPEANDLKLAEALKNNDIDILVLIDFFVKASKTQEGKPDAEQAQKFCDILLRIKEDWPEFLNHSAESYNKLSEAEKSLFRIENAQTFLDILVEEQRVKRGKQL
jgi:hypothetical protein